MDAGSGNGGFTLYTFHLVDPEQKHLLNEQIAKEVIHGPGIEFRKVLFLDYAWRSHHHFCGALRSGYRRSVSLVVNGRSRRRNEPPRHNDPNYQISAFRVP